MASTFTTRYGLEKQEQFSNPDSWGIVLNAALDRLDETGAVIAVTVDADIVLTADQSIANQARSAGLILTGAGGFDVQALAQSRVYIVANNCTADVTLTPAGGAASTVRAGTAVFWYTDGSTGYTIDPTLDMIKPPVADVDMNGQRVTGAANPTSAQDLSTKAYVDQEIVIVSAVTNAAAAAISEANAAISAAAALVSENEAALSAAEALASANRADATADSVDADLIIAAYDDVRNQLAPFGLIRNMPLISTKTGSYANTDVVLASNYAVTGTLHISGDRTAVVAAITTTAITTPALIVDDQTVADALYEGTLEVLPTVDFTISGTTQVIDI